MTMPRRGIVVRLLGLRLDHTCPRRRAWPTLRCEDWQRPSGVVTVNRAKHDISHHVDEPGVVIDRFGSDHRQPERLAYGGCLLVEVVQHLDVVAHEPYRAQDCGPESAPMLSAKVVAHVRFEPRILRTSAAALIHERPVGDTGCRGNEPRCFAQLHLGSERRRPSTAECCGL